MLLRGSVLRIFTTQWAISLEDPFMLPLGAPVVFDNIKDSSGGSEVGRAVVKEPVRLIVPVVIKASIKIPRARFTFSVPLLFTDPVKEYFVTSAVIILSGKSCSARRSLIVCAISIGSPFSSAGVIANLFDVADAILHSPTIGNSVWVSSGACA